MSFKKVKVVMLPTNEKAPKHDYLFLYKPSIRLVKDGFVHHLYFLSDKEIDFKKDYAYHVDAAGDRHIIAPNTWVPNPVFCSKIIAATDSSLRIEEMLDEEDTIYHFLPEPSQSFIEKFVEEYNKGNVITEVLVEYENSYKKNIDGEDIGFKVHEPSILKVNPKDNTITIRKVKDSYSREEVEALLHKATLQAMEEQDEFDFWKFLKDNL